MKGRNKLKTKNYGFFIVLFFRLINAKRVTKEDRSFTEKNRVAKVVDFSASPLVFLSVIYLQ